MNLLELIATIFVSLVVYDFIKILLVGFWYMGKGNPVNEEIEVTVPDDAFELPSSTVVMFMEETDDGILRAFRQSDSMFMCQGKSINELSENFINRFPDNVGLIKDFFTKGEDLMIVSEEKLNS